MAMLREDYEAACDLYDELRRAAAGGDAWNQEVALAWEMLVETAYAAVRNAGFLSTQEGTAIFVSATRRNVPMLVGTALTGRTD